MLNLKKLRNFPEKEGENEQLFSPIIVLKNAYYCRVDSVDPKTTISLSRAGAMAFFPKASGKDGESLKMLFVQKVKPQWVRIMRQGWFNIMRGLKIYLIQGMSFFALNALVKQKTDDEQGNC